MGGRSQQKRERRACSSPRSGGGDRRSRWRGRPPRQALNKQGAPPSVLSRVRGRPLHLFAWSASPCRVEGWRPILRRRRLSFMKPAARPSTCKGEVGRGVNAPLRKGGDPSLDPPLSERGSPCLSRRRRMALLGFPPEANLRGQSARNALLHLKGGGREGVNALRPRGVPLPGPSPFTGREPVPFSAAPLLWAFEVFL